MYDITVNIPTVVSIAAASIDLPVNDYLSTDVLDDPDNVLHTIEAQAPGSLLTPLMTQPATATFEIDLSSWTILGCPPVSTAMLAAISPATAGAAKIVFQSKVRDEFCFRLKTATGHTILQQDHFYVTEFMPGGDCDYIHLTVNLASGRILNADPARTGRHLEKLFALAGDHSSMRITPP